MIKVYVKKQSNFAVDTRKIKSELKTLLKNKGIVSESVVNVTFVGNSKAQKIAQKYLHDNEIHDVLSFPTNEIESEFVFPPDDVINLGDIIICYPKVVEEAKRENKLIDEKVLELVKHSALHLLGIHHD